LAKGRIRCKIQKGEISMNGFKDYGLKPGDRIKMLCGDNTWSKQGHPWQDHRPDYIEVIEETPLWILTRFVYPNDSYRLCLNKVHVLTGEYAFTKETA
jgi:hypothetical protein